MAMSMMVNTDAAMMDSIPRVRWSPVNNRFHYSMPVAAEPGENGFVLLQEIDHADSLTAWQLPENERHHIEEMEKVNHLIHDVENAVHLRDTVQWLEKRRTHHDEYHERDATEDEAKPQPVKRKGSFHKKDVPKRSFEARRQKPTRSGRVHQPR